MKKLVISVDDSFSVKYINIMVSEEEYEKLMECYDEDYGLMMNIVEVK